MRMAGFTNLNNLIDYRKIVVNSIENCVLNIGSEDPNINSLFDMVSMNASKV